MRHYLDKFSSALSGKTYGGAPASFGSTLESDLQRTRQQMSADGLIFIIEPGDITHSVIEANGRRVHRHEGSYMYGFEKDGVFHGVPGDISTEQPREPVDHGEILFLEDMETGEILGVYESMAGNTYGEPVPRKPSSGESLSRRTKRGLVIAIVAVFVLWLAVRLLTGEFLG